MSSLAEYIHQCKKSVDSTLDSWLRNDMSVAPRLTEAMHYSLFNGGKRIRPVLVFAAADALAGRSTLEFPLAINAAAAIECIHAYSLIHDDLPAMDDDKLRRGKPTCHIAYDQATAILAGDALQTLAFEQLSALPKDKDENAIRVITLINILARASGARGMVAGQMIDLLAEGEHVEIELAQLEKIHQHKTGALIRAAVNMGAVCSGANAEQIKALDSYAEAIGLAFQVQDDILDVVSDTATLGKQQGADISLGKSTYVSLLGLDGAREKSESLRVTALASIEVFGPDADPLRWLANYIVARES